MKVTEAAPPVGFYRALRPCLFQLDAERAHNFSLGCAGLWSRWGPATPPKWARSPTLKTNTLGLELPNPVGLAAGLDKDGVAVDFWGRLGFGFAEVGTVTPSDGQPGNPKPRLFRARDAEAIVNRMGFNNRGAASLARRLKARRGTQPVGVNLGKAKSTPLEQAHDDYVSGLQTTYAGAAYFTVNVSSPNTAGLRSLQSEHALGDLLGAVLQARDEEARRQERRVPVWVKLSPDIDAVEVNGLADMLSDIGPDAVVLTNTTLNHSALGASWSESGGLSGRPLCSPAEACISVWNDALRGRLPIVGVGGISTVEDAYRRIRLGASAVQIYSALVYRGPGLVKHLVTGLAARLREDGFASMEDAVGVGLG